MGRPAYDSCANVLDEAIVGIIGFLDERGKA
jgi:hypothetical protein